MAKANGKVNIDILKRTMVAMTREYLQPPGGNCIESQGDYAATGEYDEPGEDGIQVAIDVHVHGASSYRLKDCAHDIEMDGTGEDPCPHKAYRMLDAEHHDRAGKDE